MAIRPTSAVIPASGPMIRQLKSGEYRLDFWKKYPRAGKHRNLGPFKTRAEADASERAVQYYKQSG